MRLLALLALSAIAACGGEPSTQIVTGRVDTAKGALAIRAIGDGEVVTAAPVRTDGSFTLALPAGSEYRLEILTRSGVKNIVMRDGNVLKDLTFKVCEPVAPFDCGDVGEPPDHGMCDPNDPSCTPPCDDPPPPPPPCDPMVDPDCTCLADGTCCDPGDPNCPPPPCSDPMDPNCQPPPCSDPMDPNCQPPPCDPTDPSCNCQADGTCCQPGDPNCPQPCDPMDPTCGCNDPMDPACCAAFGTCGCQPGDPSCCDPATDPYCQPPCMDPSDPNCGGGCEADGTCGCMDPNDPGCVPPCPDPMDPTTCNDPCLADPMVCGCTSNDPNCWPAPQPCGADGTMCDPGDGMSPTNVPEDFGCR
jgi:hypothetical protein